MDKRPTRPPRKFHARRPPAVRDAAISAEIAAHLAAAPTPPPPISPDDLRDAADLIDAAAPLITPPPSAHAAAGLAGLAAPGTTALAPPNTGTIRDHAISDPTIRDPTIRDSDGFLAWVQADPGSRVRVAKYLARCYQTGKLSAPMAECGISRGLINCLCQRHPIIRAAMQIIAEGQARGLVHRAREVVDSIMDAPDDQAHALKAASIALQYSERGCADAGNGPGNGDGGPGGVQIVINLGQQADTPRRIAPDDVRMADQDAIFIVGGGK